MTQIVNAHLAEAIEKDPFDLFVSKLFSGQLEGADEDGRNGLMHAAVSEKLEKVSAFLIMGQKPKATDASGHDLYYYIVHPKKMVPWKTIKRRGRLKTHVRFFEGFLKAHNYYGQNLFVRWMSEPGHCATFWSEYDIYAKTQGWNMRDGNDRIACQQLREQIFLVIKLLTPEIHERRLKSLRAFRPDGAAPP